MHAILFGVVGWLLREVVIKFIVLAAIYGAMVVLLPIAMAYAATFVNATALTSAFAALPAGLWYFLDWFQVGFGAPLVISAIIGRFIVRRLPLVG